MSNKFLKINKDLFNIGLAPLDILIVSQIIEFQTNTNDCFISNETLANQFGVSESTVKRSIDKLEKEMRIIERNTKNIQKGKERHIRVKLERIEELAKSKMNLAENDVKSTKSKMNLPEGSKCPLRKGQNEPIKDKNKNIIIKDNLEEIEEPNTDTSITYKYPEEVGKIENPIVVEKEWLMERYNELTTLANGIFRYKNLFYKIKE